ncbi:MAG: hypothetical protein U1G07_17185 [Verrucomicrobiota bacterium]
MVVGFHSVEGDAVGNGFITGPAFEGGQFLDLKAGHWRGRLTQAFGDHSRLSYRPTFAYTDNYWELSSSIGQSSRLRRLGRSTESDDHLHRRWHR